ncbi:MAG: hypothetical protein PF542_02515 [Nanoarchaeota archaeon]|jgi:hypothetical protein|nr:hypothetical protein [Nanoarchaeota archaeon]
MVKKKVTKKRDDIPGQIFVGCLFLGLAIGTLAGSIWIGALFGLGVGFISKGIFESIKK